jgi:hypothetical protein
MVLMLLSQLIRWGGLAAMLAGALWTVLGPLITFSSEDTLFGLTYEDYNKLLAAPLLLLLVGLAGLHARFAGHAGCLGWTSFVIAFVGLALLLIGNLVASWINPVRGVQISLISTLIVCGGLVLFSIAAMRANVLPRWSRALPILIGFLTPAQYIATGIGTLIFGDEPGLVLWSLFGVGWMLLGYALWLDSRQLGGQPQPSSGQAPG